MIYRTAVHFKCALLFAVLVCIIDLFFVTAVTIANTSPVAAKYGLQVAAYRNPANAKKAAEAFRKLGYPAFIREKGIDDKSDWHRVFIDAYASKSDARKAGVRLKKKGIISDFIPRRLNMSKKTAGPIYTRNKIPENHRRPEATGASPTRKGADSLLGITEFGFRIDSDRTEVLTIKADGPCLPEVRITERMDAPRLELIFDGATYAAKFPPLVSKNATLIEKIEIDGLIETPRCRIVVRLIPQKRYAVSQRYLNGLKVMQIGISEVDRPFEFSSPEENGVIASTELSKF